jgi:hypothetical protein
MSLKSCCYVLNLYLKGRKCWLGVVCSWDVIGFVGSERVNQGKWKFRLTLRVCRGIAFISVLILVKSQLILITDDVPSQF